MRTTVPELDSFFVKGNFNVSNGSQITSNYRFNNNLHSWRRSSLLIAMVPTPSHTMPPAIFAMSAASAMFLVTAYMTEATAITVSPAPLTSAMFLMCVGIIFAEPSSWKNKPCSDRVIREMR